MPRYLDAIAQCMTVALCALTWNPHQALAQNAAQTANVVADGDAYFAVGAFDLNRPFERQAFKDSAIKFAGYYAPYAIQAALAYRSDHQIVSGQDDFGDSANAKKAKGLFQRWQYMFDSDSYVICAKPGDSGCNNDQSGRWNLFSTDGLYYQVWARQRANTSCSEVSIAFRGTINSSVGLFLASWSSNFHSAARLAHVDDEYDQLARRIDAIITQIKQMDCYRKAAGKVQIVSVGHSLGGGLAELAAFAHDPKVGRITKVFTFNASPITAQDLVGDETWDTNRRQLTIDRVYQEGEVLSHYATIRGQQQTPALNCDPLVRTVQFNAVKPGVPQTAFEKTINWISPTAYDSYERHGIGPFAAKLVEWTDERKHYYEPLPGSGHTSCQLDPDYQMLGPPRQRENESTTVSYRNWQGNYAASSFDAEPSAPTRSRSRRSMIVAVVAPPETRDGDMTATEPGTFGPVYSVTTQPTGKVSRSRRLTTTQLLPHTVQRTAVVSF